jgi:hypothetical protein
VLERPDGSRELHHRGFTLTWSAAQGEAVDGAGRRVELYGRRSEPGCVSETSGRVVSVVGTYVSVEVHEEMDCEGAAHPSNYVSYRVLDLAAGGREVSLTDLVPEAAVLRALLNDPVIQRALGGQPVATLSELYQNADGGCEMLIDESLVRSFAFHHLDGDQVAVRIGLSHGCEASRGAFTQLGVLLFMPQALMPELRESERLGLLMEALAPRAL